MNRKNKSISDTSLVNLPLRKKLLIQEYLSKYDIYVRYFKNTNCIQFQNGVISMHNMLMSGDKVFIYEHSQVITGYYMSLEKFIKNFRGNAFFEDGRENLILCIEKNTTLYRYCLENYDNFFNIEPECQCPDIKLFIKLFKITDQELFVILDF